MSIKKIIIASPIIAIGMSGYVYLLGSSSTSSSVESILLFSTKAASSWNQISTATGISINNTGPGELQPLIPAQFSAIDLVIYGSELVESQYKKAYEGFAIPRLASLVVFSNDSEGALEYHVGGAKIESLSNMAGDEYAAIFFTNVNLQTVNGADLKVDNHDGGEAGVVRYKLDDDGLYTMGVFVPYPTSIQHNK